MGDAYEVLRRAVLTMELLPRQALSERGLESLAGASRTPVRAALVRLAHEGLTVRDGRGWRVAPLDLDEVRAVVEHREVVECGAVALAVERATPAGLDAVQVLAESAADDADTGLRDGAQFHVALARLSCNDFLADAVEGALTRLARTRWLEVRSGPRGSRPAPSTSRSSPPSARATPTAPSPSSASTPAGPATGSSPTSRPTASGCGAAGSPSWGRVRWGDVGDLRGTARGHPSVSPRGVSCGCPDHVALTTSRGHPRVVPRSCPPPRPVRRGCTRGTGSPVVIATPPPSPRPVPRRPHARLAPSVGEVRPSSSCWGSGRGRR